MSNNIESRAQALSGQAKVFTFNASNQNIRVQMKDGEPWFVAKDVCAALGIVNHLDAISRLDEDEKGGGGSNYPLRRSDYEDCQ